MVQAVTAQKVLRTIFRKALVRFSVQSILASEIRNTAFRRNTSASQKRNLTGFIHHLPERLYLAFTFQRVIIPDLMPLAGKLSHDHFIPPDYTPKTDLVPSATPTTV
jgi:hypothetical protein